MTTNLRLPLNGQVSAINDKSWIVHTRLKIINFRTNSWVKKSSQYNSNRARKMSKFWMAIKLRRLLLWRQQSKNKKYRKLFKAGNLIRKYIGVKRDMPLWFLSLRNSWRRRDSKVRWDRLRLRRSWERPLESTIIQNCANHILRLGIAHTVTAASTFTIAQTTNLGISKRLNMKENRKSVHGFWSREVWTTTTIASLMRMPMR